MTAAPAPPLPTVSSELLRMVQALGVDTAYGLIGGAIAPFFATLCDSGLEVVQLRHEASAAFAACEHSLWKRRPALLFTTTGPGLTNALTGIFAARSEGAQIIVVNGNTPPAQRGRLAVQETSDFVFPAGVAPSAFDLVVTIDRPEQLGTVAARLQGLARRGPFVANLQLPLSLQGAHSAPLCVPLAEVPRQRRRPTDAELHDAAAALGEGPFAIWVGFGARDATAEVLRLAEHTGALVCATPRAKGVFPERHPQYLGVTGFGGHEHVERTIDERGIRTLLVLGSRLGEFSTIWEPRLVERRVVHVDLDPTAFAVGFPASPLVPLVADVASAVEGLLPLLPRAATAQTAPGAFPVDVPADRTDVVRPVVLMQALQRTVVDADAGLVLAEPGSSFAWTNHYLRFPAPTYRMSGFWASMGHMTAGAIGAAVASRRPTVVVTGDASMLMLQEMSAAAALGAHVVWVVLNDARMSITDAGLRALGYQPRFTEFPRCDFAAIARASGCHGITVRSEHDVDAALAEALGRRGPTVIDVIVDRDSAAPFSRRNKALAAMGARRDDIR